MTHYVDIRIDDNGTLADQQKNHCNERQQDH
jgi:hypothetical protein